MEGQVGRVSTEMETQIKNQRKMMECKITARKMKNVVEGLVNGLAKECIGDFTDMSTESSNHVLSSTKD